MNQKGFIHIPLLVVVITLIVTAAAGTVMVWHNLKNSKISSSVDQFQPQAQAIQGDANKENINVEKTKPAETISESPSVLQKTETVSQQSDVELAKAEAEKAKQETEKAKIELEKLKVEQEKLKQIQPVIQQVSPQPHEIQSGSEELKIEECKSEYDAHKSEMIADVDKQLNDIKSVLQNSEEENYKKCVSDMAAQWNTATGIDLSGVSGQTVSSTYDYFAKICQKSINEAKMKVALEFDNVKKSKYNKVEQQLQAEYQQCLQE